MKDYKNSGCQHLRKYYALEKHKYFQWDRLNYRKSYLINRTSGIGDILMMTALVKRIREENPQSFIMFRTNQYEILKHNPYIDEVKRVKYGDLDFWKDTKEHEYDVVLNYWWALESHLIKEWGKLSEAQYLGETRFDIIFKWAGMNPVEYPEPYYRVVQSEREKARKIWDELEGTKRILYVINSNSAFRTYPIGKSIDVLNKLIDKGCSIIVTGKVADGTRFYTKYKKWIGAQKGHKNLRDCVNTLLLRDFLAVESLADLVISPDSGALHAAYCLNVPCIGLFADYEPWLKTKYYDNCKTLYGYPECACGDQGKVIKHICPFQMKINHGGNPYHYEQLKGVGGYCTGLIDPDDILELVEEIFKPIHKFLKDHHLSKIHIVDNLSAMNQEDQINHVNGLSHSKLAIIGKHQRMCPNDVPIKNYCLRYFEKNIVPNLHGYKVVLKDQLLEQNKFIVVLENKNGK